MTSSPPPKQKPNILVVMSDEHGPMFSGLYGHPIVRTPHLDALGRSGITFDAAYCNSPLCVPSRASFLSGKLVGRVGAYDNGAPFPSDTVTFAHLLGAQGYDVVLDGKMHFVGPDTLHGFERQLTRDTSGKIAAREWSHSNEDHRAGGDVSRRRISEAGPGRSRYMDYDDEVESAALEWLREPARADAPWCLVASFLTPHFPLTVPEPYLSMYPPATVDLPVIPPDHLRRQHPAHERVRRTFVLHDIPEERVRAMRAAYYGLVTFLDEKIGRLVAALRATGQHQTTLIVYTADHGELAGEHGLWWKNSFYEQSARVPVVFSWPGVLAPGARFAGAMSNVDVAATLVDVAGGDVPDDWDGDTLLPLLRDLGTGAESDDAATAWKDEAIVEYYGHATNRPQRMLRTGRWKYSYYHREAAELYDLQTDPGEFTNRSGDPDLAAVESALRRRLLAGWDPDETERRVRRSQRARHAIARAGAGPARK